MNVREKQCVPRTSYLNKSSFYSIQVGTLENSSHLSFVHLSVPESFLNGVQGAAKQVGTHFLKTRSGDGGVKVNAFKQRIDLDAEKDQ